MSTRAPGRSNSIGKSLKPVAISIVYQACMFETSFIDLMPRSPSVPTAAYGGLIYGKGRFNYAILLFVLLFA